MQREFAFFAAASADASEAIRLWRRMGGTLDLLRSRDAERCDYQ